MTATPNAPVVVVTEEKKRRKGLMWVAGGAALLLGGSTFALWSATDAFSGGTITAGDLDLTLTEDTTFWDVSYDRADSNATVPGTDGSQQGHALTPSDASTWRMVPGDKAAAAFSANLTLEGDNLVGRLSVSGMDSNEQNITGMSYSYQVYKDGVLVVEETPLPATADSTLMFLSAPTTGQAAGLDDATVAGGTTAGGVAAATTVFPMTQTTEDLTVVVYAMFFEDGDDDFLYTDEVNDTTVTDRTDVTLADTLAGLNLRLDQVRDTGSQFN